MARFPSWIYRQSAVLPYRRSPGGLEVLLISSRKGKRWVLPKGIIEPGMTAPQSAAKEAAEEAGVSGPVGGDPLGHYSYRKWGGTCRVEVFPMLVEEERADWPESGLRRRTWLSPKQAARRLKSAELRKILRRLRKRAKAAAGTGAAASDTAGTVPRLIYLLRHARARPADPEHDDFERPLTSRGRRDCEAMARYVAMADAAPEVVLSSSATRARETLEAVLPALGGEVTAKYDRRLYTAGPLALGNRLRRLPEDTAAVMLVGHNPAIQALATELAGDDPAARELLTAGFPAGGLAILVATGRRWRDLGPGSCRLHSLVGPNALP